MPAALLPFLMEPFLLSAVEAVVAFALTTALPTLSRCLQPSSRVVLAWSCGEIV